jgi:hypothetical protein
MKFKEHSTQIVEDCPTELSTWNTILLKLMIAWLVKILALYGTLRLITVKGRFRHWFSS